METTIVKGKEIARAIKEDVLVKTAILNEKHGVLPGLAVILVGEDPASQVYVKSKTKTCKKMGFHSEQINLTSTVSTDDLLEVVNELNNRNDIHGILVQLPLPEHLDKTIILDSIDPRKDVDGFHPFNLGQLVRGTQMWSPCTPAGIMRMFSYLNYDVTGKEAVILGRSDIVGKPMALLLLHANATVTLCHSKTRNLAEITSRADILISAMGKPGLVTKEFVKKGAFVVDVATVRIEKEQAWDELLQNDSKWHKSFVKKGYALVGDVRYHQLIGKAKYLTPVPGGVGPLTIAMLMYNTVTTATELVEAAN